ncbi:MAG: UbiH/UbiF family hydroxylase [Burkholderiales bacterium]
MIHDVAIVGGGPVGATLALSLVRAGLNVALIEPGIPRPLPADGFDHRVYALSQRTRRFLECGGVWGRLALDRISPIHDMQVFGDEAGSSLRFSAYRSQVPELAVIVEESNLRHAIEQSLVAEAPQLVRVAAAFQAASWREGAAVCELADGSSLEARLLVAADGTDSKLRAAAGLVPNIREYGQTGLVVNFRIEIPHRNTAYQWFLPDGVLALLPLPGDCVSMVWSLAHDRARTLRESTPDILAGAVEQACQGILGKMLALNAPAGFPLRWMRLPSLIAPRLVVVGDAAHNVHPLAGQGLNLGFGDVEALAAILAEREAFDDCGARSLLRRYERSRQEEILAMQCVTDGLNKLFGTTLPGIKRLRNLGLRVTDLASPLKRWLVHRALG